LATLVEVRPDVDKKSVTWDAFAASSCLYSCQLIVGDYTEARRMMLVE
jgi:hypothetical protein